MLHTRSKDQGHYPGGEKEKRRSCFELFVGLFASAYVETPYGEVHVCGSKETYEELTSQGKMAFSPIELLHLQKASENGCLETIVKIKCSIPGARIKEIIPAEKKKNEDHASSASA